MDIKAIIDKYKNREISVEENTKNILEKIKNDDTNAYITFDEEDSLKRAKLLDEKLASGAELGSLFGIAVAVKDNISYKNMNMTCASKMLENFRPMFDAKVVENLLAEDAIIIAKTNMDELLVFSLGLLRLIPLDKSISIDSTIFLSWKNSTIFSPVIPPISSISINSSTVAFLNLSNVLNLLAKSLAVLSPTFGIPMA